jgi:hypothetical protein
VARVKTEVFTVRTVGAGQPDYAQPITELPVERALIVKFPESEVAGKRYDDFAKISFTSALTEYVVGTNANAAKAGSWPSGVLAKEIAFLTTQPCLIRFNSPDAVAQEIPSGIDIIRFFKRVERFYVTQDVAPGILYAWIEG